MYMHCHTHMRKATRLRAWACIYLYTYACILCVHVLVSEFLYGIMCSFMLRDFAKMSKTSYTLLCFVTMKKCPKHNIICSFKLLDFEKMSKTQNHMLFYAF